MIGHNTAEGTQLAKTVERIERLEEDKKVITEQVSFVYAEAKSNGFDPKILRKIVALRRIPKARREEEEALFDTYMHALGMAALEG